MLHQKLNCMLMISYCTVQKVLKQIASSYKMASTALSNDPIYGNFLLTLINVNSFIQPTSFPNHYDLLHGWQNYKTSNIN